MRDEDARDEDGRAERSDCVDDRRSPGDLVPLDDAREELDLEELRRNCDGLVLP